MPPDAEHLPGWSRRLIDLADHSPGRAVELAHQTSERTPWHSFTRGWTLLFWERLGEARARLRAARDAFAASPGALGQLLCDYGLLLVDQRQLARQGFDADLASLASCFESRGEHGLAFRARLDQARQLNLLGRLLDSKALLDELERSGPSLRPPNMARLLRVRAVAASVQGEYRRAVALLDEAEQRFRRARQRLELARCWFERAAVAANQERLDDALALCARAEEVFHRYELPLHRAFCLKVAGVASIRQGRYDDAFRQTYRARDLFQGLGRERDVGACIMNLGNIYYHTGTWAAALEAYAQAEEHYVAAGLVGYQLTLRRNRAMVYRASGRSQEARTLLSEVERQAVQLDFQAETAEIWAAQAALLADEGRVSEAVRRYNDAHNLFLHLGNGTAAAECMLELGWIALRAEDHGTAASYFEGAAPSLRRRDHHAWRVHYGQARCAELTGDAAAALQHYAHACVIVGVLRRRLASEGLSSDLYAQAVQLHVDALLLALTHNAPAAALVFIESQRALTLQRAVMSQPPSGESPERIPLGDTAAPHPSLPSALEGYGANDPVLDLYERLLLHPMPDVDTHLSSAAAWAEDALAIGRMRDAIQAVHGDDWTAVVYALLEGRLVIVCVTSQQLSLEWRPLDATMRRLLERASQPAYRYYTYNDLPFLQGISPRPWAGLNAIAAQLLPDHVQARLHPHHRLLIVPAGPLHALSWGALRVQDRWLAEAAVVQLIPSLTLAPVLFQPQGARTRALIVGCSSFQGRAKDLPGVAAELTAVRQHWPGACEQYVEQAATREVVRAAVARSSEGLALVHIASHAQLLGSHALAAHIKLWDSDLQLQEIALLHLAGTLVVLSACEGAAADVLPGEEVLSLSWGFLAGGARAVVASLWPLSDQLAPAIMGSFYQQLASAGDAALALALTHRTMIGGVLGEECSRPQVWAALQIIGGPLVRWTTGGTAPSPAAG